MRFFLRAYTAHDIASVRRVQARLKKEIKEAKSLHKEKVEKQFRDGNHKQGWIGIKTLTGQNTTEAKLLFVGWLLNVPATCECISGTDLHRQFYVLPH